MMSGAPKASEYTQVRSDTDTISGLGISMGWGLGGGGVHEFKTTNNGY